MKTFDFKNKTIWITGASSGIGASLALQLNALGAIVISSARRLDKLENLRQSSEYPDNIIPIELDITCPMSIDKAVKRVELLDQLDLIIHNAGIAQKGLVIENKMEVDRAIMETNYFGTVALTKAIMPKFQDQGSGWFAVVSSFAGVMGIPGRSAYAASKHALHGFFNSLKAEIMGCDIDVSFVIPGFINTEITAKGLRGDGTPNGAVETSHRLGMSADQCARETIKGLKKRKTNIVIGKFEVYLITIKRWFPSLAQKIISNHPMKRIRKIKTKIRRILNIKSLKLESQVN